MAPAAPDVVLLQVSEQAWRAVKLFKRLTLAAVALYALLHGYVAVYYDGSGPCDMRHAQSPPGWAAPPGVGNLHGCKKRQCCWQGRFWLRPEWLKPAAIVDAMARWPSAAWFVSLDQDAAPRYPSYSVAHVTGWLLRHTFRSRGAAEWREQRVVDGDGPKMAGIVAREAYAGIYARSPAARQRRLNTGIMLLRGTQGGRELVRRWWESRDDDCRAHCTPRERRGLAGGMWACQRRGMFRLWDQRDQSALGHWVLPRLRSARRAVIAEVPHVLLNSHSGLLFAHFYNERWRLSGHVYDWAREHAARHAAAAAAAVCATPPACAAPGAFEQSDKSARRCAKGAWATAFAKAALLTVVRVPLQWGNESSIDARCYRDLSLMVQAEVQGGRRR